MASRAAAPPYGSTPGYLVCLADRVRIPIVVTCALVTCGAAASGPPPLPPEAADYEPVQRGYVDGATGFYHHKNDDLVLAGSPRFVLQRTYRSGDRTTRRFGVGATHNGERYLRGNADDLRSAELILEDSTRIRFERTSPGRGVSNAMFEQRERATEYSGARLGWVGAFWGMWLQNGAIMIFKPCSPTSEAACSLTRMRDSAGHWTHFRRDDDGMLREIAAGTATIAFEYDDAKRITRAKASTGRFVEYGYDQGGRLVRVRTSGGVTSSYSYGSRGEMLTIDEPGWFIRNTYRGDRVVRQDTELRGEAGAPRRLTFTWEYAVRGDRVLTTKVERPDGSSTRYDFDQAGYHVAETLQDARGRSARIALERDRATHAVLRLELTCPGANGRASEHQLGNRPLRDRTAELLQSCWKRGAR